MSAFVVDKAHINAMVDAGLRAQYKPMHWYTRDEAGQITMHSLVDSNASEVGQMLLDECIRSVGARYEGSEITDLPGRTDAEYIIPFEFKLFLDPPTPVQVLKLISCYEYQSCETDDWETTEAYHYCHALRANTIDRLAGYDAAPWEWETWPADNLVRLV